MSQTLYVAATPNGTKQGYWIISATDIEARERKRNATRAPGDRYQTYYSIKCRHAKDLEDRLAGLMGHFRPTKKSEFYRIRYDLLIKAIELFASNMRMEEQIMDEISAKMLIDPSIAHLVDIKILHCN